jgi:IclR family acetate operon transcriptional repressor
VARALDLIDLVASVPAEGISVSEIARELGVSKSTAYALARTLVDRAILRAVDPGPRYQPGMALIRLGDVATRSTPLGGVVQPILLDLSRDTGLTSRAAVVSNGYPVFIARIDSPGAVRFHTPLGVPELPHTSSAGKAILATLSHDEVARIATECGLPRRTRKTIATLEDLEADLAITRRRGYAIDDEEDVEGVFCIAAAFFDHAGRCAGAVSATGIKVDLPSRRVEELGAVVKDAARRLTNVFGGRSPGTES